jgi:hypothetical protein
MVRVIADVRWHQELSAMRRAVSLAVEAAITLAVVAFFVIEGFSGNIALTIALVLVGITSLAMFLGALATGRGSFSTSGEPLDHPNLRTATSFPANKAGAGGDADDDE